MPSPPPRSTCEIVWPSDAQVAHEFGQQREGVAERIEVGDLAADMHVDAGHLDARQLGGMRIDVAGAADRNAELVLGLAGGNLVMGLGVDVGIDAYRDVRDAAFAGGDLRQQIEFGFGFDIDAENAFVDRQRQFARRLAQTGEHDLVRRNAGGARALQLAFRHHIRAGAELGQRLDDGLVGIRLHGVANQRIDIGESAGEHFVVPLQRRGRIAIERRADACRRAY